MEKGSEVDLVAQHEDMEILRKDYQQFLVSMLMAEEKHIYCIERPNGQKVQRLYFQYFADAIEVFKRLKNSNLRWVKLYDLIDFYYEQEL